VEGGNPRSSDIASFQSVELGRAELQVRLLGRVELEVEGRLVALSSARQRELLVVLALSAAEPVSVDSIVRALWYEHATSGSRGLVHTLASRLRKTVGNALVTRPGGYVLRVPPENVDLFRFRSLVNDAQEIRNSGQSGSGGQELALLREALALWSDEPFVDLTSEWLRRFEAPRLVEEWFGALERRLDLELDAGRHGELLAELQGLIARYPLREALWARLILALYRSGRQAEAFTAYRTIVDALREEYGADPGDDLKQAYQMVLHGGPEDVTDSAVVVAPRPALKSLPRDLEVFTARDDEVRALLSAADRASAANAVIYAIQGMAGVGKTALAVHVAHMLADRYPDGQIYLNLHGHTPGHSPLHPGTALRQLLSAFDVDPSRIPAEEEEAAALWRSTITGRQVLLLLDNAADSAQVRPLLPGGASLTLVTSRRRLTGLDGARVVSLGLPNEDDAKTLFIRMSRRAEQPDSAVLEIVSLCGQLPLAMAVAAARLQHHTAWTTEDLLARLRDQRRRINELRADDRSVESVLAVSFDQLPEQQRDLLVAMAWFMPAEIDAHAAAALADTSITVASTMLDELSDTHLLDEPTAGRYRMHDLIRAYCQQRATSHLSEARRSTAASRLLAYWIVALDAVDQLLRPHRKAPPFPVETSTAPQLRDEADALAWCDVEHRNLMSAVSLAAARTEHDRTGHLAWLLWPFLDRAGSWDEMIEVQQLALAAARASGNQRAEARVLNSIGMAYSNMGQYEQARESLYACESVAKKIGHQMLRLSALNNIGVSYGQEGLLDKSIETLAEVARETEALPVEDRLLQASSFSNLGEAYQRSGNLAAALQNGLHAVQLLADVEDTRAAARQRIPLVETYRLMGDLDQAIDQATAALSVLRRSGDQSGTALTLTSLAKVLRHRGDTEGARKAAQEAVSLLGSLGAPQADAIRRSLADLVDL
jgi:DNA-binding SARP family transcriptional activator